MSKCYLAVPYSEKEEAKQAGARWDATVKAWYAPKGLTPELERWKPQETSVLPTNSSPQEAFLEALTHYGLQLDSLPTMDGQLHRVPTLDDARGEKSGAYVGFLNGWPAGYIQNFKTGLKTTWKLNATNPIAEVDKARLAALAAQQHQQKEAERHQKQAQAALRAQALWKTGKRVTQHPYLRQKKVKAYNIRLTCDNTLMIPIRSTDGTLWSLQFIHPDGTKRLLKDGQLRGNHHKIGTFVADRPIILCEGYATRASLYDATGFAVAICFHAGNLLPVGQALREAFPDTRILVAGDNDHQKERKGQPNVGKEKATEAAEAIGGQLLLPDFAPNEPGTDWNDWLGKYSAGLLHPTLKHDINP